MTFCGGLRLCVSTAETGFGFRAFRCPTDGQYKVVVDVPKIRVVLTAGANCNRCEH